MSGIFMSYRRDDAAGHAGRLYDRLRAEFGPEQVFRDLDSLTYGTPFLDGIRAAVATCDSMVVVIGHEWVTISHTDGGRRLDDARDFVRLEVAAALERGIPVIPVLVEGAEMPSEDDLPVPLVRLRHFNGLELSDSRWDFDVTRLVDTLERWTPKAPGGPDAPPPTERLVIAPPLRPEPVSRTVAIPPTHERRSAWLDRRRVLVGLLGGVAVLGLLGLLLALPGGSEEKAVDPAPAPSSTTLAAPTTRTATVAVEGTRQWTDTAIVVEPGDQLHITATGTVFHSERDSTTPDGAAHPGLRVFNILTNANHAGLLGRIGATGSPFVVGRDATRAVTAGGTLYLGINDQGVENNHGSFSAKVELTRRA